MPRVERRAARLVGVGRLAEQRVLAVAVHAEPEPEHHAPARQPIERRRGLGDELRPAARQRRRPSSRSSPARSPRRSRQRHPRVGERRQRPVPQVVPDEDAVPPGRLGGAGDARRSDRDRPARRTARSTAPSASGPGPYPAAPVASSPAWNASASSASPTPGRARCTTPSPAAARSPRRTRSPPRTPTSASPRCPTSASTGWPRCPRAATSSTPPSQVVDIGGLVEGASKGEGLGNKFLANIREVDAIVFVLRAFVDDDVTGPSDPHRAPARRRDRARPRRPRDGREAPQPGHPPVQARQDARRGDRRPAGSPTTPCPTAARSTGPGSAPSTASCWRRTSC